jgi:hypothetical protein
MQSAGPGAGRSGDRAANKAQRHFGKGVHGDVADGLRFEAQAEIHLSFGHGCADFLAVQHAQAQRDAGVALVQGGQHRAGALW